MVKMGINKNEKKFQQIEESSVAALSQFYKIVDRLNADNESLEQLHAEIDAEMEGLANIKTAIVERISKNDKTLAGIQQVLGN